jgi:hypothetical protein
VKKGANCAADKKMTDSFIFWKLTIDREARHIKLDPDPDSDDDFDEAFKRMSGMKIT